MPKGIYIRTTPVWNKGKKGILLGSKAGRWKGGIVYNDKGYRFISMPTHPQANSGGYVREHILVIEKSIGRFLLLGEVIHHIDGDRKNNDIKNLRLFESHSKHMLTMHGKKGGEELREF